MRLLLAEDDKALADELQSVLEAAGYAVDRAHDGEDARYAGQTEDYDLDSNIIEVYVRRLRQKLGKDAIETRRGQGYVFHG